MFVSIFPFSKRQQKYRLVTSRILTSCFSPTMAARPYHGFSMTRSLRIAMVRVINLFTNFERCSVMSRLSLFCALYAAFPPFLRWTVLHDPLRGIRNLGKNINSCSWGAKIILPESCPSSDQTSFSMQYQSHHIANWPFWSILPNKWADCQQ